jgi:hypothetical protein
MKWEEPKLFNLSTITETLGHCQTGSSATMLQCGNGEQTSATGVGHNCSDGGCAGPNAGGCSSGTTPGPGACN